MFTSASWILLSTMALSSGMAEPAALERDEFPLFALDGSWKLVRVEVKGDGIAPDAVQRLEQGFAEFWVYTTTLGWKEGTSKIIRHGNNPCRMTIHLGDKSGEVLCCIYQAQGDGVRIAFGKDLGVMPTSFDDRDLIVLVAERAKPVGLTK